MGSGQLYSPGVWDVLVPGRVLPRCLVEAPAAVCELCGLRLRTGRRSLSGLAELDPAFAQPRKCPVGGPYGFLELLSSVAFSTPGLRPSKPRVLNLSELCSVLHTGSSLGARLPLLSSSLQRQTG